MPDSVIQLTKTDEHLLIKSLLSSTRKDSKKSTETKGFVRSLVGDWPAWSHLKLKTVIQEKEGKARGRSHVRKAEELKYFFSS